MYSTLFQLAGLAILGWIPLIFVPTWRGSRRLAASQFFPIYISVFYALGVGALLMERGPGFIADFGTDVGVARLLAEPEIAWVAWLHILAFDQVIGLMIYRENMRHRYVPIPVQSALLFLTLMFGPLGYLAFTLIRVARLGSRVFALEPADASEPARAGPHDRLVSGPAVDPADPVSMDRRIAADEGRVPTLMEIANVYREERGVTITALSGVALGAILLGIVFIRGPEIRPEGDLMKPATFDLAVGIFILSLIPWLPAAGFTDTARRLWRRWMIGLLMYSFAIETIQQLRGIDPRFSQAEPASQIFGALFFASALGITVLSIWLGARAFEARAPGRRGLLVVSARWAGASMLIGFFAGMWLTANRGRFVGEAGNLLPLHAAGFHALQAVPLIALMLAWSAMPTGAARRWIHVAGAAWAAACVAIWWQTAHGRAVTDLTGAGILTVASLGIWTLAAVRGLIGWRVRG
jgi:hypothetical protein